MMTGKMRWEGQKPPGVIQTILILFSLSSLYLLLLYSTTLPHLPLLKSNPKSLFPISLRTLPFVDPVTYSKILDSF